MPADIRAAEVVLSCPDLDEALAVFVGELGFRIDTVIPADDPVETVISGHGTRLRLVRGPGAPVTLRLLCRDPAAVAGGETVLVAPGGTRIELVAADPPVALPPAAPSFVVSRGSAAGSGDVWRTGRAGMRYRDLIPDRHGGRLIASHIRILDGGPVPDYVHFHAIRFQLIFCRRGWVRLVYEDQGEPFVMEAGDCVVQPPRIRHRVLESSAGLEVVELTSPAVHATHADHDLPLPTGHVRPGRDFDGQRFVWHRAAGAAWSDRHGAEARDLEVGAATGGLVDACVLRRLPASYALAHDGELRFGFVLAGQVTLDAGEHGEHRLAADDSYAIPPGRAFALAAPSPELELLEIRVLA